ncbi:MAG: hypothetical protein WDN45_02300 [Caulobacteraceae bacterium]
MSTDTLASALGDLDSDDAADVIDDLEDDRRDAVLAAMSDADRTAIKASLGYKDETAGRLMQREVIAAPQFWTVGQTLEHLRGAQDLPELFFDVYVVDPSFRPIGAAPLSRMVTAKPELPMAQIMEAVTEIPVDMDQEEVAYAFEKYRLISAPVIDKGGRLVARSPSTTSSGSSARRARKTPWPWPASATWAATPRSSRSPSRVSGGWW